MLQILISRKKTERNSIVAASDNFHRPERKEMKREFSVKTCGLRKLLIHLVEK